MRCQLWQIVPLNRSKWFVDKRCSKLDIPIHALDVGQPAYDFFVALRNPYFAAVTGANLAEASFELGDLDRAERFAREVLGLDNRFASPYARFTLGQIALVRGQAAAAIADFTHAMQLAKQNDDPYMVAYAQRALGQAYKAAGDLASATIQASEALELFRQLDIAGEISATEHLLAELQTEQVGEGDHTIRVQ